jgi:ubiquinone/menaquinone biosynthesis C-methylase UbiE
MPASLNVDSAGSAWEAFWCESNFDGCTLAFPSEARDRIVLGWRRALADLGAGQSVLDVACGKGAVLQHAAAAGFARLTGVDLAPTACLVGTPFDLRGEIDARALPFSDRAFDAVVSQFGLEYAGLEAAVGEAARVCSSAVVLLMHAADGVVVAQGQEQVAQIDWLDRVRAFARMRAYVESGRTAEARDVEKLAREIVEQADAAENVSLLEALYRCATGISANPVPCTSLDALEQDLRGHAVRMRELIAAAPAPHEVEAAGDILRSKGFVVEIRPEGRGTDRPLIGRWVIAHRGRNRT